MRKAVGLEAMPSIWHNVEFEEKATLEHLGKFFEIQHRLYRGVYDFISRIVHPLLVAPDEPKYDSHVNEVASKVALKNQEFGNISRVFFLVLKRLNDKDLNYNPSL